MIVRVWRGWAATVSDADAYESFLAEEFLPFTRKIPGYKGAEVLRRVEGHEIEFVTLTRFDDLGAIRAFAGDDPDIANVPARARELLARWDSRCTHHMIALSDTSR